MSIKEMPCVTVEQVLALREAELAELKSSLPKVRTEAVCSMLLERVNKDERASVDGVSIGSKWRHRNGCEYEVITIANKETQTDKYPVTVVYRNVRNGKIWSRPLNDWHRSMALIPKTKGG